MADFLDDKVFRFTIVMLGLCVTLVLAFGIGVYVGVQKADFSESWAKSYQQNFGSVKPAMMPETMALSRDLTTGYGCNGRIISKDGQSITVLDKNNIEKKYLINEKTIIMCQRIPFSITDLQDQDDVVIIGEPESNGTAKAILIRVFPKDKNCTKQN